ncbi:MAG TPA: phosphatase PAP2 family protein [Tenuifilaceae bacterium]|nr:phosphatase PAP2 family protein [Tenuifilaceae bacterium]
MEGSSFSLAIKGIVTQNFLKVKFSLLYFSLFIIGIVILFLFFNGALNVHSYVYIQKGLFIYLNAKLSQLPNLMYNLTQLGDAFVLFSLISILLYYAPKIWEALFSASLLSLILSGILKNTTNVPRPAQILDRDSFVIIKKAAVGFSSLPSGHSITIFTTLTILLFAFMPTHIKLRILWSALVLFIGLAVVSTRVGMGAHYPLDVVLGASIGYACGILGIVINQKHSIWQWISLPKFYPFFILAFFVSAVLIALKIADEGLPIFYFSLLSLIISLFLISKAYVEHLKG